jgi:serine/threonine protein kinase/formylglycine-generating enzyme required for sulfatase activity
VRESARFARAGVARADTSARPARCRRGNGFRIARRPCHGPAEALYFAPMSVSSGWAPPARLGEYTLVRPLGSGGMGHVWLAHDDLLDRFVALKVIDAADPRPEQRERFLQEARAAARLSHPNVLAVYRVGELGRTPYIVAELVTGDSLDRLARPLPWRRVAELGVGLARGLAAAHRVGVLHRDLKPSNAILTEDGTVKIVDFGLAKLLDGTPGAPATSAASAAASAAFVSPPPGLPTPVTLGPEDRGPTAYAATISFAPPPEEAPAQAGAPPSLTRAGALLGTPYYMSPEAWRGEPQTHRSDLYSLGALLFELAAGAPPFAGVAFAELPQAVQGSDAPRLASVAPGVDPGLAELVDALLARAPDARPDGAEAVREALERLLAPRAATPRWVGENPYRGLSVFDAEHREVFFGRAPVARAVVEALRGAGLVTVTGDSGVGKSSLARAGVLPLVADGALGGGRRWATAELTPGARPLAALASALAPHLALSPAEIAERLAEPPAAALRTLASALGPGRGLCLLVDQLEELCLPRAAAAEAAIVARFLAEVAASPGPVRVLATARSDYLTRLAALPGLASELLRSVVVLPPLDEAGRREAILHPALAAGVRFEPPELVDELVAATADAHVGLPLLSFALAELWEARDVRAGVIDRATLRTIGGVEGALARHADAVIAALTAEPRAAARRLLLALVDATAAGLPPQVARLVDGPVAAAALEALVRGRLVRVLDSADGPALALAHAQLASAWATLREWIDAVAERRALRERVVRAAGEWERLGRTGAALWIDRRLAEVDRVPADELGPRERDFVRASRRARRRRLLVRVGAALALPALLGGAALVSRVQAARAVAAKVARRLDEAEAARAAAARDQAGLAVARQAALAAFDRGDHEAGEASWHDALAASAALDLAWTRVAQLVESALLVDAHAGAARDLLADALYARALLAESENDHAAVDELLGRMALYDADGRRARRWRAPATLALTSVPPGASVTLERFVDAAGDVAASWEALDPPGAALATTPAVLQLAPGSYRAHLAAPGRAPVLYPFLLTRGERLDETVTLPLPGQVPPGFTYVPVGRFLVGTGVEDRQRRDFFQAVPLHQSHTGAYLVQTYETTWAAWIQYLEALPPAQRAAHLPRAPGASGRDAVDLRDDAGGWTLGLQPGSVYLSARLGEPLRYPGRHARREQDWRRLPVTGVSAGDVRAYAAFVAERTGLPVRMCQESEWERAARGADGRTFPHGQRVLPDDVNYEATYGRGSDAVGPDEIGSHPASASPFGVQDMAGNAFELVAGAPGEQWVRGGAYAFDILASRTEMRDRFDADLRNVAIGFRLCADVPAAPLAASVWLASP